MKLKKMIKLYTPRICKEFTENKQEPYAYNVGTMMPYMNYTPKTFLEIKKGIEEYEYI